jgi:hypothetical protein
LKNSWSKELDDPFKEASATPNKNLDKKKSQDIKHIHKERKTNDHRQWVMAWSRITQENTS